MKCRLFLPLIITFSPTPYPRTDRNAAPSTAGRSTVCVYTPFHERTDGACLCAVVQIVICTYDTSTVCAVARATSPFVEGGVISFVRFLIDLTPTYMELAKPKPKPKHSSASFVRGIGGFRGVRAECCTNLTCRVPEAAFSEG